MVASDTEQLLEPAQDLPKLRAQALAATQTGRWAEAIAAWEPYTAAAPEDGEAWGLLILSYRESGRLAEADSLGTTMADRFPREWRLLTEWALVPFVTRDWPAAAARWARVRDTFPGDVEALMRSAAVAEELGDQAGAAGFLEAARHASGDSWWTVEASARYFERHGALQTALALWRLAAAQDSAATAPVENLARCLNSCELFDEAEAIVAARLERAEPTEALLYEHARAASGRNDWSVAVPRWQAVVAAYPANGQAEGQLGIALWHNQVEAGMHAAQAPAPAAGQQAALLAEIDELDGKTLSMCFESLGDNCEFGLFQRHQGAEPIGLYRWGAVGVSFLIEALHARFEGMGDPEHVELEGHPGDEYTLRDRRHWLEGHTFVPYNEEQFPRIFKRQAAAVSFLRERLLQDLEEPWKIFVYKPRMGTFQDHEFGQLRAAIDTVGDAALLCVRVPEDPARIGTLERMGRGLYVGNISRVSPTANKDEIDMPGWLLLCRLALRAAREDGYQVGRA